MQIYIHVYGGRYDGRYNTIFMEDMAVLIIIASKRALYFILVGTLYICMCIMWREEYKTAKETHTVKREL